MSNSDWGTELIFEMRLASHSDTNFARHVHHAAYHDVVVRQFGLWDEEEQDRFFEEDWRSGRFNIILFTGFPCGYSRVDVNKDSIIVHELVISPEFQRKGIGTAILNQIIKEAETTGMPVRLGALKANRAVGLYRRLGFRDVDSTETHVSLEYRPA